MQFTLLTLVTLFAAAMAAPQEPNARRQAAAAAPAAAAAAPAATGPSVQSAAMTDASGNVIAFDAANVYLDSVAKGM